MTQTDAAGAPTRRPRGPGFANTAIAAAILLVMALFASTAPQQPPPAIAAFAPQPKQLIKEPPPEQTTVGDKNNNNNGRGPGNGQGGNGVSPSLPPQVVKGGKVVPRLRDCVGQLQIDDPQSPPCVPGFIGDNGGATSFGVTRDAITVAVSQHQIDYTGLPVIQDLFKFFNKRFEFYGRQLVMKPLNDSGTPEQTATVDQMVADAISVHDELKAFISEAYGFAQEGQGHYYYDKLAALKILSTEYSFREPVSLVDQASYTKRAPYQWNFSPTLDQVQAMDSELICSALARRPAKLAGTPDLSTAQRKLGIIVEYKPNTDPPKLTALKAAVKRCTGQDLVEVLFPFGNLSQIPQLLNTLRSEKVTTVMCLCYWATLVVYTMPVASNQGYYPEWFVDSYGVNDLDQGCHTDCPGDQAKDMFGLRATNKARPLAETPYFRAIKDVDPTYQPTGCQGCSAKAAPGQVFSDDAQAVYENLLLIASGVQGAGPHLTPQSFEDGLVRTKWPNPGCDGAPFYQGCVGFSPSNHSMLSSYELEHWSDSDIAPQFQTPGTFCYLSRGLRFRLGGAPKTDDGLAPSPGTPCN